MAANAIENPFTIITDTDGTALDNGYVYIGTVNTDPEANPVTVYWDIDLAIPAAQPIRTINGYFSRSGSPGKLYVDTTDYSITVRNKNSVLLYSSLANSDVLATTPMSSVTGQLDSARVDFTQTGTGAVLRTVEDKFQDIVNVKDFGALGDDSNDDTAEIQAAIDSISSGTVYIPAGTYKISATININTTKITLRGDGNTSSILKAAAGFTGSDTVHMVNPTSCVLEDFQIEANSQVANGLHIDDGIGIAINRLLVQNCTALGYKVRNVDDCVLNACGSVNTTSYAFDFIASAALDGAASINGIRCKMIDCYSTNAGTTGSIFSNQVDTSTIDVVVERFNEISNAGSVSVATGSVHLDHVIKLVDCIFLDTVPGIAIVINETNIIRTPAVSITGVNTPVLNISAALKGDNYVGLLVIQASSLEFHDVSDHTGASYVILVTRRGSGSPVGVVAIASDGQIAGSVATDPSFTWALDEPNGHLEASPIASTTGSFYFYITQLGGIVMSNI